MFCKAEFPCNIRRVRIYLSLMTCATCPLGTYHRMSRLLQYATGQSTFMHSQASEHDSKHDCVPGLQSADISLFISLLWLPVVAHSRFEYSMLAHRTTKELEQSTWTPAFWSLFTIPFTTILELITSSLAVTAWQVSIHFEPNFYILLYHCQSTKTWGHKDPAS